MWGWNAPAASGRSKNEKLRNFHTIAGVSGKVGNIHLQLSHFNHRYRVGGNSLFYTTSFRAGSETDSLEVETTNTSYKLTQHFDLFQSSSEVRGLFSC